MAKEELCPICRQPAHFENSIIGLNNILITVTCERCGRFSTSPAGIHHGFWVDDARRYVLSSIVRNMSETGIIVNLADNDSCQRLMETHVIPDGPFERIDMLLEHVRRKSEGRYSDSIVLSLTQDYPLIYARDNRDFRFHLDKALELGLFEGHQILSDTEPREVRLSLTGWQRLAELKAHRSQSDQAFVAMWFDKSLDDAWENGFKPALKQTGYKPLRIDKEHFNDKICDRIVNEVRKSALLVADITGERSGVFFEAGLALGRGIPVIWTCRKDYAEKLKEHFDTRQYNHIIWSAASDLHSQLVDRIEATVGRGVAPTTPPLV